MYQGCRVSLRTEDGRMHKGRGVGRERGSIGLNNLILPQQYSILPLLLKNLIY